MRSRLRLATALLVAGIAIAASPAAAAVNDSFAGATPLSGLPASATGSNLDATAEPGEPAHSGSDATHSVWWRWVAAADGGVNVSTCDSDFDTVLAVYTGDAVDALAPLAANDDACELGSSVTFLATAGQEYRIAVDGSGESVGTIALALRPALTVRAETLVRRGKLDATRFFVELAPDEFAPAPRLILERPGKRISIDLQLHNEGDFLSDTTFRYTFKWECGRAGTWTWTLRATRNDVPVTQQGTLTVPECVRKPWFVSRSTVVSRVARDFDRATARALRCKPVGARRGARAARWRCTQVRARMVCTGSFRFRFSRLFQGNDLISSDRKASGTVTCRG